MTSILKPSFRSSRTVVRPSEIQKKQFASAYRDVASLSLPIGISATTSESATVTYSQRDLAQDSFRRFTNTFFRGSSSHFSPTEFLAEASPSTASFPSPSGRLSAALRTVDKKSNMGSTPGVPVPAAMGKSHTIDIFSRNRLVCSVPTYGVHGKIYTGPPFGSLTWSVEEDFLVYPAEILPAARESFFKGIEYGEYQSTPEANKDAKSTSSEPVDAASLIGTEFDFQADWGEQLNEAKMVSLFMLHIPTRTVIPLAGIPPSSILSCGQPIVAYPSGSKTSTATPAASRGVVFTGFPVQPRRLGLIFYNSRPQSLFFVPVPTPAALTAQILAEKVEKAAKLAKTPVPNGTEMENKKEKNTATTQCVCLTPHLRTAHFPRFSPDFDSLVFLSNSLPVDTTAPVHCTTSTLALFPWPKDLELLCPPSGHVKKDVFPTPEFPDFIGQLDLSWLQRIAVNPALSDAITFPVPVPVGYVPTHEASEKTRPFPGLYTAEDYAMIGSSPTLGALSVAPGIVAINTLVRSIQTLMFARYDSVEKTGTAALWELACPEVSDVHYQAHAKGLVERLFNISSIHESPASVIALAAGPGFVYAAVSKTSIPPAIFLIEVNEKSFHNPSESYKVCSTSTTGNAIPVNTLNGKWTFVTSIDLEEEDLKNAFPAVEPQGSTVMPVDPLEIMATLSGSKTFTLESSYSLPTDSKVNGGAPQSQTSFHFDSLITVDFEKFASSISTSTKLGPKQSPLLKGIVLFPHGGPHSAFTTSYDFVSALFASLGLVVVRVNYRGSVGFGETALASLPPLCGRQDVDDCVQALEDTKAFLQTHVIQAPTAIESVANLPVFLFGGSHGGYLVTHLTGQFPDAFSACVARNPVVNMPYTVFSSDIPDWCFVESGEPFKEAYTVGKEFLGKLYDASPIAYVSKITTPTMLHIGTGDKRVPPTQSYDFYRVLQTRGIASRLVVYKDAQHGLNDKPLVHADSTVNSIAWFATYGGLSQNAQLE